MAHSWLTSWRQNTTGRGFEVVVDVEVEVEVGSACSFEASISAWSFWRILGRRLDLSRCSGLHLVKNSGSASSDDKML